MDVGILVSKLNNHSLVETFADADILTHSLSRHMQDSRSFSKSSWGNKITQGKKYVIYAKLGTIIDGIVFKHKKAKSGLS